MILLLSWSLFPLWGNFSIYFGIKNLYARFSNLSTLRCEQRDSECTDLQLYRNRALQRPEQDWVFHWFFRYPEGLSSSLSSLFSYLVWKHQNQFCSQLCSSLATLVERISKLCKANAWLFSWKCLVIPYKNLNVTEVLSPPRKPPHLQECHLWKHEVTTVPLWTSSSASWKKKLYYVILGNTLFLSKWEHWSQRLIRIGVNKLWTRGSQKDLVLIVFRGSVQNHANGEHYFFRI